jgi:hypothetical protein
MSEPEPICQRCMEVLDFTEVDPKLLEELGIAPGGPFQTVHGGRNFFSEEMELSGASSLEPDRIVVF